MQEIQLEVEKIKDIRPCASFLKIEVEMSDYQIKQAIKTLEEKLKGK